MAVLKLVIERREPLVCPSAIRWHMGTLLSPFKGCQNQWRKRDNTLLQFSPLLGFYKNHFLKILENKHFTSIFDCPGLAS